MKKALLKFVWIYVLYLMVFLLMKPVFMTVYRTVIGASAADWLAVLRHGAAMDMSVAGYLTLVPGLLIACELITGARWVRVALNIYMGLTVALVAIVYCLDMGLYGSWGFRLDMTPVFYFTTSPSAAMASVQWWQWIAGATGMCAICCGMWLLYRVTAATVEVTPPKSGKARVWMPMAMVVVTALLIIPIRGSLTVSTMNLSRAYFSTNPRLNHAAVNPMFSLLYSATHQDDFRGQYAFMPDAEAAAVVDAMLHRSNSHGNGGMSPADNVQPDSTGMPGFDPAEWLTTDRPDIVVVILESFSAHLMPSLGGADVAVGLDSLGREGVLFSNFYASSFRTDRALGAILGSFPSPPNTSLLRYVGKFDRLTTFPEMLKRGGYDATYIYGGDANFTNMQAFLVSAGFDPVISDKDFPIAERTSKWGAHDGPLFDKAFALLSQRATGHRRGVPQLTVIQTSSSHEPFEVPYSNPRFASNPRLNAFAYTDSCLTAFVDHMRALPSWDRTLLVILPDHYGCWPEQVDNPLERHRIPLVLAGGALARRGAVVDRLGMQTDLGATLLELTGTPSSPLRYSRNILDPQTAPLAIFTEPSLIGIVTPADTIVANPDADPSLPLPAKAFLRDLYSTLDGL